jgi:hypothetical protein
MLGMWVPEKLTMITSTDEPRQIHARLGEVQYMASTSSGADEAISRKYLAESLKRFCRSVELCDDYLRGYYGLKRVSYPRGRQLLHGLY